MCSLPSTHAFGHWYAWNHPHACIHKPHVPWHGRRRAGVPAQTRSGPPKRSICHGRTPPVRQTSCHLGKVPVAGCSQLMARYIVNKWSHLILGTFRPWMSRSKLQREEGLRASRYMSGYIVFVYTITCGRGAQEEARSHHECVGTWIMCDCTSARPLKLAQQSFYTLMNPCWATAHRKYPQCKPGFSPWRTVSTCRGEWIKVWAFEFTTNLLAIR